MIAAAATAVLAVVTWHYARSTKAIADSSRQAAEHSRRAAEATLIQAIVRARPQLTITGLSHGFAHLGTRHASREVE